jgi:hypothetical protein
MEALNNNLVLLACIVGVSSVIVLVGYALVKLVRRPKKHPGAALAESSSPAVSPIDKAA